MLSAKVATVATTNVTQSGPGEPSRLNGGACAAAASTGAVSPTVGGSSEGPWSRTVAWTAVASPSSPGRARAASSASSSSACPSSWPVISPWASLSRSRVRLR